MVFYMLVHMAWVSCTSVKAPLILKDPYRFWSNISCHLDIFFSKVTSYSSKAILNHILHGELRKYQALYKILKCHWLQSKQLVKATYWLYDKSVCMCVCIVQCWPCSILVAGVSSHSPRGSESSEERAIQFTAPPSGQNRGHASVR